VLSFQMIQKRLITQQLLMAKCLFAHSRGFPLLKLLNPIYFDLHARKPKTS
jgi:hypothetical protein